MTAVTDVGTYSWVDRTGGQLTGAERRSLLPPLARTHAVNAVGRLSMLARLNTGLRAQVDPAQLVPPSSALTRAAGVSAVASGLLFIVIQPIHPAAWPARPPCTSGTTATAGRATSTSSAPPADPTTTKATIR
jgi:hypothetical protein